MSFAIKIERKLKGLCRAIQICSTTALAIFIVYVCYTSTGTQSDGAAQRNNVSTTVSPGASCSSNTIATREGCVPCPRGTFSFPGWGECTPWLNCSQIALQVHPSWQIRGGITKLQHFADWNGYPVVLISCRPMNTKKGSQCAYGLSILPKIQGEFVTKIVGRCPDKQQMVTMFYKHGSARFLGRLLQKTHYDNIQTRLQLSADYLRITDFLHNSPIGVRVMCDAGSMRKLLSQYLITDDFRMVVNDVDRLLEVTEEGACTKKPKASDPLKEQIEWQDKKKETGPLSFNLPWHYDEKTDIWKLPWVLESLLGGVNGSDFAILQLRDVMERCHASNPQERPTANEVLQELLRVKKLILNDSS